MGEVRIAPDIKRVLDALQKDVDDGTYWPKYFARRATEGPELKPLGKPCHDCAVVWGLYTEFSDRLKNEPEEIQRAYSARWFCHNHPNRACRGNIDNLALPTPSRSKEEK